MATNIITVFCEGPHDVAFLSKILKAAGYRSNDACKIGDFPFPFNDLIQTEAQKSKIEDLNLQELRRTLLPSATLKIRDHSLFFYAVGGDSRKDNRLQLMNHLVNFIPKSTGEYLSIPENTILSALYFFDADKMGVNKRLSDIADEIKEKMHEFEVGSLSENGQIVSLFEGKLKVGAFIFSKDGEETGKLEDILVPLMKQENEEIFENAEGFIDRHFEESRCRGKKFDKGKSVIGTVGQLQKSGGSNVVCIEQTDYLTDEKVLNNALCKTIITFFDQFINE